MVDFLKIWLCIILASFMAAWAFALVRDVWVDIRLRTWRRRND